MTKAKKTTKKTGAWQQHTPRAAEVEGEEIPSSAAQEQGKRQLCHHKPVDYVRSVLGYTKDDDAYEDYVDSIEDVEHDEIEDANDLDSKEGKVESDQDADEPGDAPNDASEVDAGNRAMVTPDTDDGKTGNDGKTESETTIYQRYIQAVWTVARAIPEKISERVGCGAGQPSPKRRRIDARLTPTTTSPATSPVTTSVTAPVVAGRRLARRKTANYDNIIKTMKAHKPVDNLKPPMPANDFVSWEAFSEAL